MILPEPKARAPRDTRESVVRCLVLLLGGLGLDCAEPEPPATTAESRRAGAPAASSTVTEAPSARTSDVVEARSSGAPAPAAATRGGPSASAAPKAEAPTPAGGPELRFTRAVITRAIEADLAEVVGAEEAAALAQVAKRVLVWWIDPRRDLRKGDQLDLVWSPREDEEPVVWAVWFESEKLGEERVAVLHHADGAPFPRWVDADGREVPLRLRGSPVATYEQITSLVNDGRGHQGVDFKAPEGTPVVAPFAGKITRVNWSTRSNGRCIELRDPKTGRDAYFLHLSRIADGIRPGARVKRGQRLGAVGNTGHSFAPHLHYQLEKNDRVLDPFRVHDTWRADLPAEERRAARARLQQLQSLRTEAGG